MSRVFPVEKYDKGFLLKLLRDMVLVRRVEEKAGKCTDSKKIGGFCHL